MLPGKRAPRRRELASGRRLPHRLHGRAVAPPPDLRRGAPSSPPCDLATARRRISPDLPERQGRPGRDGHAGRGPRGDGRRERESGELERGEGGRPPDARPGAHVRLDSGGGRRLRPGRHLEGVGASGHGLPQAERGAARRLEEDARTVTASLAAGEERFSLVQGPPSCLLSALATMPLHDLPGVAGGPSHRPPAIGGQRRADFLAAVRQAYGPQIPPSPRSQLFTAEASGSCTLCGVCSAVCPEGALHLDGAREALTLSFRGDRCIGCGFCVSRCPEAALRVRPAEDITDVVEDRPTPLATSRVARCRRCGTPLGAVRSLERLAALLADDPVVVQALEYCSPCKMARLAPPETPPR